MWRERARAFRRRPGWAAWIRPATGSCTPTARWSPAAPLIDSIRDGINIDCCRNVRISDSTVNTHGDDAIVLKSSYALGYAGTTEQITIANCVVSGYDVGTVVGGTLGRDVPAAPDGDGPTGRIKLGTESNGGFRAIAITNVIFARCRGIALETVDGGTLEDVTINNVIMREISSAPIFLRLGGCVARPPLPGGCAGSVSATSACTAPTRAIRR